MALIIQNSSHVVVSGTPAYLDCYYGNTLSAIQSRSLKSLMICSPIITLRYYGIADAADSTLVLSSQSVSLIQHQNLIIQNSNHVLSSSNIVLTAHIPNWTLQMFSGNHSLASGNISLTQHQKLIIQSTAHTPSSTNISIIQHQKLVVQSSGHVLFSGNASLVQHFKLVVQSTTHISASGSVSLVQHQKITIQNTNHAVFSTNILLAIKFLISVQNTQHSHISGEVAYLECHDNENLNILDPDLLGSLEICSFVITLAVHQNAIVYPSYLEVTSTNIILSSKKPFIVQDSSLYTSSTTLFLISYSPNFEPQPDTRVLFKKVCKNVFVNNLEEIHMIAGDEGRLVYNVCDEDGIPFDLNSVQCTVSIFKYENPLDMVMSLPGVINNPANLGQFYTDLTSIDTSPLYGVYQQQVNLIEPNGKTHIPSQGRIVIFPRTEYYVKKFE